MMIFDRFDRIRIIHLPHRHDRRREMDAQLVRVGLGSDPRVEYFSAIRPDGEGMFYSRGAHGCFLSHRCIIDEAAHANQSVLVLEDDCEFNKGVLADDTGDWNFLWGGVYAASDWENLQTCDLQGAHFMGMDAATVKKASEYFKNFLEPNFQPDALAAANQAYNPDKRPGIDGAYVWFRRAHPELVTVFPECADQRPSPSDIGTPRWFDRVPIVRTGAAALRRIKGRGDPKKRRII